MAKGVTGVRTAKRVQKAYDSALQQARMTKEQLRKLEGHLKHRNGGMIQQVGLHELPQELLLGALILLSRKLQDPAVKALALKLGKQAMAEQAAKKKQAKGPPEVFIAFPDAPPETLLKRLKEIGLRFNRRNMEWRGPVDPHLMVRAVVAAGWDRYVLRSGYVGTKRSDGDATPAS
jgi:hypothetical protein